MSEEQRIREKYAKLLNVELTELRSKCEHESSEWLGVMWAPGHFTDYLVKNCTRCGQTLEQKAGFIDVKIVNGEVIQTPIFTSNGKKYSEEERIHLANLKVQQSFSQKGGKGT